MAEQRIKGQEVTILIVRDGVLEDTLNHISNFNFSYMFELKKAQYLGQKTETKDTIFNGVKIDFELHLARAAWFDFLEAIKKKAKRETPNVKFNVSAVLFFPNGETRNVLIPDVAWGEVPHNIPSRGDFVRVRMSGEAEDAYPQAA